MSDDVRPFFGEEAEVLPGPTFAPPVPTEGSGLYEEHGDSREAAFIRDGICPWCSHDLDDDLYCATCGINCAVPRKRRVEHTAELSDDYVPVQPGALLLQAVDEFAPAVVDWDAA